MVFKQQESKVTDIRTNREPIIQGVSIQFFRGHTDIFQSPLKCFFSFAIGIKFLPVIGYWLKFVKM